MEVGRRGSMIGLGVISVAGASWPVRMIAADDLPPDFTQATFNNLTATESSVEGESATERPTPVHNMSKGDVKDLKAAGGTKVIDGDVWKQESPEQRDAHLRQIRERMPDGARLIISVPTCNVWLIPPMEDRDNYDDLKRSKVFREWAEYEVEALGKTVGKMPKFTQSDRRNSGKVKQHKSESK
jgi:hypothetical protein